MNVRSSESLLLLQFLLIYFLLGFHTYFLWDFVRTFFLIIIYYNTINCTKIPTQRDAIGCWLHYHDSNKRTKENSVTLALLVIILQFLLLFIFIRVMVLWKMNFIITLYFIIITIFILSYIFVAHWLSYLKEISSLFGPDWLDEFLFRIKFLYKG